jgi:hypothetical protein
MPALQIIESEEAVMDQGAGSSSCQPVTFPRLGRRPVLFKNEALHVPIDKPLWSVNHKGSDRFKCPGLGESPGVSMGRLGGRPTPAPTYQRRLGSPVLRGRRLRAAFACAAGCRFDTMAFRTAAATWRPFSRS